MTALGDPKATLAYAYLNDMDHRVSGEKLARLLPDFVPTQQAAAIRACLPV